MSDACDFFTCAEGDAAKAIATASAKLGDAVGYALVFTPAAFHFGRLHDGQIDVLATAADGRTVATRLDPDSAYELRLFGAAADIHWRRDGRNGRMAIMEAGGDTLKRSYLMWGEAGATLSVGGGEWTMLRSPRIRPIPIPVAAPEGARLALCAEERIRRGEDGNASIAFERLTGIDVHPDSAGRR